LHPKNASADFQNFCRLASKKGAKNAVFFGLEGNTAPGMCIFSHEAKETLLE